jgi:AcrR family transcriptional regulator
MREAPLKSEETRGRILAAAMELFRTRGFAATTMRDIAREAGVALGSAYYYFESKEALVMAFYRQTGMELHEQIVQALSEARDLEPAIRAILDAKFRYFAPNRRFLGALFGHAADPENPLSPFSEQTREIRETDVGHFARALDLAPKKIPPDLLRHLPGLLWMYQMGLILFWIYDRSPRQARTAELVDKSLPLVVNLIRIARMPLLRPVRKMVVDLLNVVES